MNTDAVNFISPIKEWDAIGTQSTKVSGDSEEASLFKSIFDNVVNQVYETQADADNKKYLLATGQLDDAHSLPIAEAKASLSLEVLVALRNKTLESYNELMKMSI